MTQAIGMAPGLASLVMYIGSTDTAIISSMTITAPCQLQSAVRDLDARRSQHAQSYFEKMATQGQNFFSLRAQSTWSRRVNACLRTLPMSSPLAHRPDDRRPPALEVGDGLVDSGGGIRRIRCDSLMQHSRRDQLQQ